ncbi:hypothetical protein HOY80DRAFT_1093564 [Tuber brumale]|nr:hypothetical protein HOY80DRAFT_1093564 [Tuber brumale]
MVLSPGDNRDRRGGGSKSTAIELLTLRPRLTREWSNSFPSVWNPARYTGWHTGVLYCATSVVVVLFINISLTIYAAANPEHNMEGGVGTLYLGSCDKSRKIGMWLHLGINFLSTLLLSGSNYTQQCLAAPTRSEIDAAHALRRWMDIGIPSIRNLLRIKRERMLLWIAIGVTSIPLHLLYNSAVYNSIAANDFVLTLVTNDHFEQVAYSNMTEITKDGEVELFSRVLEGYNNSPQGYEDLTPPDCTKLYNTDFMSSHRNLFLITKHSSNATHNNTLLNINSVYVDGISPSSWMCDYELATPGGGYRRLGHTCNPSDLVSSVMNGVPWRLRLPTGGEVEISGCKSERTSKPEECKVQFSLGIMIVVICCNFVKACSMIMAVVRSREPTLVSLGDAVDSFLRIPDSTTIGICFANQRFIKREWKRGGTGPRQWRQRGAQRWWTGASKTRWITCNLLCSIAVIVTGVFLRMGIVHNGKYLSTDIKSIGFGKANTASLLTIRFRNITQEILLANLPQTILSFLYLTYNSLFTCMLSAHEWPLFSHHHRTLRVTSPRPGQRSTYWLQIPYTYAIPLISMSGLLHWLISQSIFFARIEVSDPLGRETPVTASTVGYSCIAIIFVLSLGLLSLLTAAGMGHRRFAAEATTVGSCSAAISAACHAWEPSDVAIGKKVRWGDVGIVPDLGVRHLTFSSERAVGKPVFGASYSGK